MHFHAIILTALSAGALSVSLTAKDLLNSNNRLNSKCKGKDNGNNVNLGPFDPTYCEGIPNCQCVLYEPPNGSYIWADYYNYFDSQYYPINVFSDTKCVDLMTTIVPSTHIMTHGENGECVFMGEDAHWGSVMAGKPYPGQD